MAQHHHQEGFAGRRRRFKGEEGKYDKFFSAEPGEGD
jgi:hypothetical protein